MFLVFLGIKDFFVDIFSKMLFGLVQGFLTILYWLERVFKMLAGVEAIPGSDKGAVTILDAVLGDSITAKLIILFMFLGLATFIISLSVGLIRANIKKDTPGESKKVLATSFKALFYFVFIPTLFVVATQIIGQIMNVTVNSIANTITVTSGSSGNTTAQSSIANTLFYRMFSGEDRKSLKNAQATFQWNFDDINSIASLQFTKTSFQYIIIVVVAAIMFWTLGISTVGLAERIINVVILYLLAPLMIGSSPLDGGHRLNIWKDKVLTKLFGAMGNILSMYIFLLVLGVVGDIVDKYTGHDETYWILTAVYAVVCIAGAMMCCKGSTLVASLISQSSGQEEGLSTMTTSQLAGQGMRIAGAGLAAVTGGALAATKALASKGLGATSKSVGSAGGALSKLAGGATGKAGGALASAAGAGGSSAQSSGTGGAMNLSANAGSSGNGGGSSNQGGPNALQKGIASMGRIPLVGGALATTGGLMYGAGKLASKGVKKAAQVASHPVKTAKSVGSDISSGANRVSSGIGHAFGQLSARNRAGLGNVSTRSMGSIGKDSGVKQSAKELSQANKSLFKAQKAQTAAQNKFNKLSEKMNNNGFQSNDKLQKKLETSRVSLEKANTSLSAATTNRTNADNKLLANQLGAAQEQSRVGGKKR